jgi:hypothetical protein
VVRLLNDGHDGFRDEARAVLQAGLTSAAWITVDATDGCEFGYCLIHSVNTMS